MRQMEQQIKQDIKQANIDIIQQQQIVANSVQDNILGQIKQTQNQNTNKLLQESAKLKLSLEQILPKQ